MATTPTGMQQAFISQFNKSKNQNQSSGSDSSSTGKNSGGLVGKGVRAGVKDLGRLFTGSFKKGGRVKRTGLALLHKGETVIPAKRSGKRSSSRKASGCNSKTITVG